MKTYVMHDISTNSS